MNRIFAYIVLSALILALSGCRENPIPTETTLTAVVETTASVLETTLPVETEPEELLLERPVSGKVCVGIIPTEVGYWRYVVVEDQEAAKAAYENAAAAMVEGEPYVKGDRTVGMLVAYGDYWDVLETGDMAASLGRIHAADGAQLYELCINAAKKAGWKEAVKPEQIADVTSAVLQIGEQEIHLTELEKLATLEAMLSGAQYYLGTTQCPFGYLLTMETAAGERLTITIAADGCGTWMSEGMYYDFGNDNQPLFDLFGVTPEF